MSAPLSIGGQPVNLIKPGGLVAKVPGVLLGVLVSSTTAGTFGVADSITANATGTALKTGTITPGAGLFIPMYMECILGCWLTIAGTSLNVTAVFATYGQPRLTPTSPPQA